MSFLRQSGFGLPLSPHILVAVSGGPDSIALAHLLIRYGRRVVSRNKITLLHVNHGWRGKTSDQDARFVAAFARRMKVPLKTKKLKLDESYGGRSWEEVARDARKKFFQEAARKAAGRTSALVFTAHQADDLAETLLWRLFTGAADTHGAGILIQHGNEVRPLLPIRKKRLLEYLKEEKQGFCIDKTNEEGRFLRSRIRTEILPPIERVFPQAVSHLVQAGLDAQGKRLHLSEGGREAPGQRLADSLFDATGLKARRKHWEAIRSGQREIHLPDGWRLTREVSRKPRG